MVTSARTDSLCALPSGSSIARTPDTSRRRHQRNRPAAPLASLLPGDHGRLSRPKRRGGGIVRVAPDSRQLREHLGRISVGQGGPQLGGLRIPHPHDEADRIENSGGLPEQRQRIVCLISPAELGAQARGSQKVGFRTEPPLSPERRPRAPDPRRRPFPFWLIPSGRCERESIAAPTKCRNRVGGGPLTDAAASAARADSAAATSAGSGWRSWNSRTTTSGSRPMARA